MLVLYKYDVNNDNIMLVMLIKHYVIYPIFFLYTSFAYSLQIPPYGRQRHVRVSKSYVKKNCVKTTLLVKAKRANL